MAKKKAAFITPPSVTQLAIGIDIGGTGTKFGIVDRDGNVLFSGEMSTKKHKTVDTFIVELHEVISEVIEKAGGTGRMKGSALVHLMEIIIQAQSNTHRIFPGKELFHWQN